MNGWRNVILIELRSGYDLQFKTLLIIIVLIELRFPLVVVEEVLWRKTTKKKINKFSPTKRKLFVISAISDTEGAFHLAGFSDNFRIFRRYLRNVRVAVR